MVGDRKVLHFRRKTIEPDGGDTHPLMTTQLSSIAPQKNKGSKKVAKVSTKSPAIFIDPLQAATDEIDISNDPFYATTAWNIRKKILPLTLWSAVV